MSVVTRLHCDDCHREVPWHRDAVLGDLPGGWAEVYRQDDSGDRSETWHACTWDCLLAIYDRNRQVNAERLPIPGGVS
jgi:hypothetical protein